MSSRQEEKERRRAEREAREQQVASKAANRRRLQLVGAAVLGIVVVGAIIAAIASSGGGSSSSQASDASAIPSVPIPGPKITDLDAAAKAAGCTWKQFPDEGHTHIPDSQTFNGYRTNPPTSGRHRITPAADGMYDPGTTPDKNNFVHTLEHGRIEIQYKPGTPKREIGQLESLFNEKVKGIPGYHELLFENNTNMPYAVAATSWQHLLGCPTFNDKVFDAIRTFRDRFIDKGREMVP